MFLNVGSRAGPGARSFGINPRAPITRVRLAGGQSIVANAAAATINWDTLDIDDVGAWRKDNPSAITPPPGWVSARVSCHTAWNGVNDSAGKRCLVFQYFVFNTTPSIVTLMDFCSTDSNTIVTPNINWYSQYESTRQWLPGDGNPTWQMPVGSQGPIFMQAFSQTNTQTFGGSQPGGTAWMQVEWSRA